MEQTATGALSQNRFLRFFQSRTRAQIIRAGIWGFLVALIPCVLVLLLLTQMGWLIETLGPLFGLSHREAASYAAIGAQLSQAKILLPFGLALVVFLLCGLSMLAATSWKRGWRILLKMVWIVLLLPLAALVLWCTEVNGIAMDLLLSKVLELLGSGLL